jgi:hypothetical protein
VDTPCLRGWSHPYMLVGTNAIDANELLCSPAGVATVLEQLAGIIFRTIVGTATGRAINYVRARLIGDETRREFVDALQAAAQRLGQDYPALTQISIEIDFFGDADVVDALLAFVQPSGKVDWDALARRFRDRYDTSALLEVRLETLFERLHAYLEHELVMRPRFGSLLSWRNSTRALDAMERLSSGVTAAAPEVRDALQQLQQLRETVQLGSLRDAFEPALQVDAAGARVVLHPRPGAPPLEGTLGVAFPMTTAAGREAAAAFDRMLRAGETVTLKRPFLDQFDLRIGGKRITEFGEAAEVTITAGPPAPLPSRLVLYARRRLLATLDVPTLQRIRGGTDEAHFATAPGSAVSVQGSLIREGDGASTNFHFAIEEEHIGDAREGWQIIQFFRCASSADAVTWELVGAEGRGESPARVRATLPMRQRELIFYRALAVLQEATGVTIPWPRPGHTLPMRAVIEGARAVRHGTLTRRARRVALELKPGTDLDVLLKAVDRTQPVSLSLLRQHVSLRLPSSEVDLGPVLEFMPRVLLDVRTPGRILATPVEPTDLALRIFLRWTELPLWRATDAIVLGPAGKVPLDLLRQEMPS